MEKAPAYRDVYLSNKYHTPLPLAPLNSAPWRPAVGGEGWKQPPQQRRLPTRAKLTRSNRERLIKRSAFNKSDVSTGDVSMHISGPPSYAPHVNAALQLEGKGKKKSMQQIFKNA